LEEREKKEEKIEMKPADRLVKLTVTRQAGDPLKGICEAIQNAFDTHDDRVKLGETPAPIEVRVTDEYIKGKLKSVLYISDNGIGWGETPEEFLEKMRLFGEKWKPAEARGEFGIGRGQTMSMIYDPNKDKFDGDIIVTTMIKGEPYYITGFEIRGNKILFDPPKKGGVKTLGESNKGTEWKIISNKPGFFKEDEIRKFIEENIRGEYPIKFNGELISVPVKGERFVLPDAYVYFVKDMNEFKIFNRGIKIVKHESIVPGWGGEIYTKIPLTTDLGRSKVFDEDENWKEIKERIREITYNKIDTTEDFTDEQMKGVIQEMAKDKRLAERWRNKKVFKLSDGKIISLDDLIFRGKIKKGVYYGENTPYNSDLNDRLFAVLDRDFYFTEMGSIDKLVEMYDLPPIYDIESSPEVAELKAVGFKEVKKKELTADEKIASKILEKIIEESGLPPRHIRWGITKAKISLAWTDGTKTIWLNREILSPKIKDISKGGAYQLKAVIELLPHIIHEMTHEEDTRKFIPHKTRSWYEREQKVSEKIFEGFKKLFKDNKLYSPITNRFEELIHKIQEERAKELFEKEVLGKGE
jgi:hypothetical protein